MRSLTASSPSPVTLTSDRSLYADDPRVRLRAEVRTKTYEIANNAIVNVTVTPEKGEPHTVEMHPSPDEPGVYLGEVIAAAPEPTGWRQKHLSVTNRSAQPSHTYCGKTE
ncbi:MAG: hypothetical protein R2724_08930 [Bryobacterales bacterium]